MPLDTSTSTEFIQDRFAKTVAAQHILTRDHAWVYEPIPIAQWEAAELELDAARDGTAPNTQPSLANLARKSDQLRSQKKGVLAARMATLHTRTVQAVGVMRSRALADATLRSVVDELSARGDSNRAIEDEGAEVLAAWKLSFGPTFIPAPGNTLAGLGELFEGSAPVPSLRLLKSEYKDAIAADRSAQGKLNALLSRLEDECIIWYGEASAVFPAGTVGGDTIRGTVPTSDQYGHATATTAAATTVTTTTTTPTNPATPPAQP